MPTTAYPEVNVLLDKLLAQIHAILAHKLVGFYLHGSLVYGDFDLQTSDIDLLVVTNAPLATCEFEKLQRMHNEIATTNPLWNDRIETAYITHDAINTARTHVSTITNISPGEPFHTLQANADWLVNWYMVREYGIALFGPPPHAVIAPIAKAEFVEVIRNHTRSWAEWVQSCRQRRAQTYAILTLCRALYTLTYGEQISKPQAAAWAATHYPAWAQLIHDALHWHAQEETPSSAEADKRTFAETVRFVHFIIAQSGVK